jgi:hypothetical protein
MLVTVSLQYTIYSAAYEHLSELLLQHIYSYEQMMTIFVFEEKGSSSIKREYAPFFSVKKSPATINDELCDS